MTQWEKIYHLEPPQHDRFRDQTALNRLLLDSPLQIRSFEREEIMFPFHLDREYLNFRKAALIHLVGEGQQEKIDLAFALYMTCFYNDQGGLFLDFLEI